jgi:hypothetical protein
MGLMLRHPTPIVSGKLNEEIQVFCRPPVAMELRCSPTDQQETHARSEKRINCT